MGKKWFSLELFNRRLEFEFSFKIKFSRSWQLPILWLSYSDSHENVKYLQIVILGLSTRITIIKISDYFLTIKNNKCVKNL